jgi:hypothetical protein
MRTLLTIACILLVAATDLHAQEAANEDTKLAELALSDDTIQLRYRSDTDVTDELSGEKSYAVFLSEERDVVGTAGLLIDTDLRLAPRLEIQLGPQAYAALLSEENEDIVAIAFGTQVRLPLDRRRGIAVVGHAFYAPDVLSFGSADNLTDFMARGEIRLSERLLGFAGYRWFRFDQTLRDRRTLQNEMFAGVQWQLK